MRILPVLLTVAVALAGCGGDDGPGPSGSDGGPRDAGGRDATADSGPDAASSPCTADDTCDDGVRCNGMETCSGGTCTPGTPVNCDDELACTVDTCIEETGACESTGPDADGDGHQDEACGGDDCDDTAAGVFPGSPEICNTTDEDCNPLTFGTTDADADTHVSNACCNGLECGGDCDDDNAGVHPLEAESCDGLDNDCDGRIDETVLITWYEDADGDGHGSATPGAPTTEACSRPAGYADSNDDCDDGESGVNPGLGESCEMAMRDDDCDGMRNEGCACTEGDVRMCNDAYFDSDAAPDTPRLYGTCATGFRGCRADGTWTDCTRVPGTEVCDHALDEDCDGSVDEGMTSIRCYADADDDRYAPAGAGERTFACALPGRAAAGGCEVGWTNRAPVAPADQDCAPDNPAVHPAASFPTPYRPACGNPAHTACFAGGVWRCVTGPCTGSSLSPLVYDWNCAAGSTIAVPALACRSAGTACGSSTECGGIGFVYDELAPPACGAPVPVGSCPCVSATSCGDVVSTSSAPIPCR